MVAVIGLCREEPASRSKSGGRAREGEGRREEEGARGKKPQEEKEKRPRMTEEKENLLVMDQRQKVSNVGQKKDSHCRRSLAMAPRKPRLKRVEGGQVVERGLAIRDSNLRDSNLRN